MGIREDVKVVCISCDEAHAVLIGEREENKVALEFICDTAKGRKSLYDKINRAAKDGESFKLVMFIGSRRK